MQRFRFEPEPAVPRTGGSRNRRFGSNRRPVLAVPRLRVRFSRGTEPWNRRFRTLEPAVPLQTKKKVTVGTGGSNRLELPVPTAINPTFVFVTAIFYKIIFYSPKFPINTPLYPHFQTHQHSFLHLSLVSHSYKFRKFLKCRDSKIRSFKFQHSPTLLVSSYQHHYHPLIHLSDSRHLHSYFSPKLSLLI